MSFNKMLIDPIFPSISTVLLLLPALLPVLVIAQNAQETTSTNRLTPTLRTNVSSVQVHSSVNGSTQGGTDITLPGFSNDSTSQPYYSLAQTSSAETTILGESSNRPSLSEFNSSFAANVTISTEPQQHVNTSSDLMTKAEKTISFTTFVAVVIVLSVVIVILLVFVVIVWTRRTRSHAQDDIAKERHYPSARYSNRTVQQKRTSHGADIDLCVDMENEDLGEPTEVYEDADLPVTAQPDHFSSSRTNLISASDGGAKGRVKALANPTAGSGTSSSESSRGTSKAGRGGDRSGRPNPAAGQNRPSTDHHQQRGEEDAPNEVYENLESTIEMPKAAKRVPSSGPSTSTTGHNRTLNDDQQRKRNEPAKVYPKQEASKRPSKQPASEGGARGRVTALDNHRAGRGVSESPGKEDPADGPSHNLTDEQEGDEDYENWESPNSVSTAGRGDSPVQSTTTAKQNLVGDQQGDSDYPAEVYEDDQEM